MVNSVAQRQLEMKPTAGSWNMPRKSTILARDSPLSSSSFCRFAAKLSSNQAAMPAEFVIDSGRGMGVKSNAPTGYSGEKALLRSCDVPGQLQRGFRNGVGTIVTFIEWNGFDHPPGGLVFILERGQRRRSKRIWPDRA